MISVIIPYVKDRGYLDKALKSLEAQTFTDFEVIHAMGDRTQGANINAGIKEAHGEFIKILHDDDVLPVSSLADLYEGIDGYSWVCGDMVTFGNPKYCDAARYCGCIPDLTLMLKENQIYGGTTLYRTDMLNAVGGYNDELITGEEYELHLRLLSLKYPCNHIPRVVHLYRLHEYNKSHYMGPGEKIKRREYIEKIRTWYR